MPRETSKTQLIKFVPASGKIVLKRLPYIDVREKFPALMPPKEEELMVCCVVSIAKDEDEDELNKEYHVGDHVLVDPNTLYKIELGRTELFIGWTDEILGQLESED